MSIAVPPVLCPACASRRIPGHGWPAGRQRQHVVESPMHVIFVSNPEAERQAPRAPVQVGAETQPHFLYACARCGYGEIHDTALYTSGGTIA